MRQTAKRLTRTTLQRLGLRVIREAGWQAHLRHEELLIEQLAGWCDQALPLGLLPRPGRSRLLARLQGTTVSEALYLLRCLHRSLPAGGDVCEFGVAQGFTSALLAGELLDSDRTLWLYDSFEGLSKPTGHDVLLDDICSLGSIDAYERAVAFGPDEVRSRLAEVGFPAERTRVVPGFLDETQTAAHLPALVCFAYLDMDLYEPTRIALALLHDRLAPGAHVVVDDYGFFSAGAKTAVDELVAARPGGYEVALPHGFAGRFCMLTRKGDPR
ncbi:MAG TPA: TylF/MycF/NovP-related O-methyltransferase [Actinomycetes bacterium]|jgi:hypothetical protein|nr:TylF/MycF/NovP-related O-methyltransferase [Actinomycetes bacterium]